MRANSFSAPGSPLHGRAIPRDWRCMDPNGKRRALVAYGYASDWKDACRIMGRHAAAVMRAKRERMELAANRRHPEGKD